MKGYIDTCGVFGCHEVYEAEYQHSPCPRCGISRAEIINYGTNDPDLIKKRIDKDWDDMYNDALGG